VRSGGGGNKDLCRPHTEEENPFGEGSESPDAEVH